MKGVRHKEKPTRKENMVCRLLKVEVSGDRKAWTVRYTSQITSNGLMG